MRSLNLNRTFPEHNNNDKGNRIYKLIEISKKHMTDYDCYRHIKQFLNKLKDDRYIIEWKRTRDIQNSNTNFLLAIIFPDELSYQATIEFIHQVEPNNRFRILSAETITDKEYYIYYNDGVYRNPMFGQEE